MKSINLIILSGILGLIISCQGRNTSTAGFPLEEITSRLDTSSGFIDVFLRIVSDDETDTSHVYVAKGLYKGKTVGLKFEVVQGITSERTIFSQQDFAYHSVKIYSIGQESDQFVKSLGDLYGLPTTKPFTKLPILSNVFSLNQKVADLNKTDYYLFKLFFEEDSEFYSEMLFNINTGDRIVELHEKDSEYRGAMMKVFTK